MKGFGDSKVNDIIKRFKSWEDILEASEDELQEIKGIGNKKAKQLKNKASEIIGEYKVKGKTVEAIILNFKGGTKTQKNNEVIVEFVSNKKINPRQLIGDDVIWKTPSGKTIKGNLIYPHGKKDKLLARFEKSLPGQALGTSIEIK